MGYRTFTDSRGTEWQAWDVVPRLGERRVSDRRVQSVRPPHTDRRMQDDRRVMTGHHTVVGQGMDAGWLCFDSAEEKRRLTPIPGDWERCAPERLEQYCASAPRAHRTAGEVPSMRFSY